MELSDLDIAIRKILLDNLENQDISIISEDDNLQEFGMSSMVFVKIVLALEEEFHVEFPDSKLTFSNLNSIAKIRNGIIALINPPDLYC